MYKYKKRSMTAVFNIAYAPWVEIPNSHKDENSLKKKQKYKYTAIHSLAHPNPAS